MTDKFDIRTQDEIIDSLGKSFPVGRLFQAVHDDASNIRRLLTGLAIEIGRIENKLSEDIYEAYFINEDKDGLLEEWESILGIPDSCFTIEGKTRQERIDQVLAKLRMSSVWTEQDYIDFAAILGFTVTIEQAIENGTFPVIFPFPLGSPKEFRFTMIVNLELALKPESFAYTFPFTFTEDSTILIVCLFNKIKQANVNIIYNYIL